MYAVVREYFNEFVEKQMQIVKVKCLDEFYSTNLLCWELETFPPKMLKVKVSDESKTTGITEKLVVHLWEQMKKRISEGIILKAHHFLLTPMERDMTEYVQGKIAELEDNIIDEMFQAAPLRNKYNLKAAELEHFIQAHNEVEKEMLEKTAIFASAFQ